jgi:hypothetical protein
MVVTRDGREAAAARAEQADGAGWRTPREGWRVVSRRDHLRRTLTTALIVGTVLFLINQLDVVIEGKATWVTWVKSGVTYLVPFIVANIGILIATRRHEPAQG